MLEAAASGIVEISTEGSMDFAAIDTGIFRVSESLAKSPVTGEQFVRRELFLDADHPAVVKVLGSGASG